MEKVSERQRETTNVTFTAHQMCGHRKCIMCALFSIEPLVKLTVSSFMVSIRRRTCSGIPLYDIKWTKCLKHATSQPFPPDRPAECGNSRYFSPWYRHVEAGPPGPLSLWRPFDFRIELFKDIWCEKRRRKITAPKTKRFRYSSNLPSRGAATHYTQRRLGTYWVTLWRSQEFCLLQCFGMKREVMNIMITMQRTCVCCVCVVCVRCLTYTTPLCTQFLAPGDFLPLHQIQPECRKRWSSFSLFFSLIHSLNNAF